MQYFCSVKIKLAKVRKFSKRQLLFFLSNANGRQLAMNFRKLTDMEAIMIFGDLRFINGNLFSVTKL